MVDHKSSSYVKDDVCYFKKTKEKYGGLSNMAAGYPIIINKVRILTSEALYQSCRFSNHSGIQREIINQKSPMSAKMKSKLYRNHTREDWDDVRVDIMKWCLRLKLGFNFLKFGRLLETTSSKDIVEYSHKDLFWGSILSKEDSSLLVGKNVLGKLLMELRESFMNKEYEKLLLIEKLYIDDFYLFGDQIETIDLRFKLNNITM